MRTIKEPTPSRRAQLAGGAYVFMFVVGMAGALFRRGILIKGDVAATATNIMTHQSLYGLACACDLLLVASYVAVVALFYHLFKPVSARLSLLGAFLGLAGCAILGSALLFQIAPTVVLGGASYLRVFSADQLYAQAYLYLKLYSLGYGVSLVFFGFYQVTIGYLAYKSTFLPRVLGVLMGVGGLLGLSFLFPAFGAKYLYTLLLPLDVGEALLPLWLLTRGVNDERWRARAAADQ